MIGRDPDNNDVHVILNRDVEILHGENLIVFMNSDQKKNGNGRVFLRIDNEEDLEVLTHGIAEIKKYLKKIEKKKQKNQYVSFSAKTRYDSPKSRRPH